MKTKRNLIQICLLCAVMLPAVAQAQFTFTTNYDGSLNICQYTGSGGVVIIPDSTNGMIITTIGTNAFYAYNGSTSITIGTNITNIGNAAFCDCSSLTNVTIGTNVATIGDLAFKYCSSLKSVTIPNSVTNIGDRVFSYCTSLTSIIVDTNNPSYSSLNGVLFDKSQSTLVAYPGRTSGSYTIPNSVIIIRNHAFEECNWLTSITFGTNVASIGDNAFEFCILQNVTIGNSVTSIGDRAFYYCSYLTNVTIPNSVTNIGNEVFSYCTSLTSIIANTNNPSYCSVNGILFNKSQTTLVAYPGSARGCYTIPNSVTNIGDWAFEGCYCLKRHDSQQRYQHRGRGVRELPKSDQCHYR